ncbi:uncharacterized protein LOC119177352 isoform X2 [Rhipicephalus microplus]|uniref:uncharacterized protein LOC119177352 isoform X2 n=1 Tax=Rhipicephalus microplus TaxID=6941 RepID=UPI003F6D65DA
MYTADNHTAHRITFANVPRLPLLAVALAHGRIGPPSCRLALLGTPIRLQSLLVLVSGFANRTVGLVLVSFAASELCSSGYRAPISCACGSDGPENSENIDMSLTGRLAAVTGGASGIGKAVAFALAKEGAVVIVGDINFCGAQETAAALPGVGHPHQAFRVDVRSGESIETFFAAIMKMFKVPLSIAVSCAGILKPAPLVDMSEEFFDEIMDINFKCCIHAGHVPLLSWCCTSHAGSAGAQWCFGDCGKQLGTQWVTPLQCICSFKGSHSSFYQVIGTGAGSEWHALQLCFTQLHRHAHDSI